jgi:hypothetical protein
LAFGLSQIHTAGLSGWRWIYIIEGAITMATAIVSWFFLVDFPQKAKFLNEKDRLRVIERLNEDRGDGEHDDITVEKILQYLSDWRIWCFGLMVFLFCCDVDDSSVQQLRRLMLYLTSHRTRSLSTFLTIESF